MKFKNDGIYPIRMMESINTPPYDSFNGSIRNSFIEEDIFQS